jgi:hypothetical protein
MATAGVILGAILCVLMALGLLFFVLVVAGGSGATTMPG